jgi:hypothetical protein
MAINGVNSQPKVQADVTPVRAEATVARAEANAARAEANAARAEATAARAEATAARAEADARVGKPQDPGVEQAPAKAVAEKAEKVAVEIDKALTALNDFISTLSGSKDLGTSGSSSRASEQSLGLTSYEDFFSDSSASNNPLYQPSQASGENPLFQSLAAPVTTGTGNGDFLNRTGAGAGATKSGGGGKIDPGGYGD